MFLLDQKGATAIEYALFGGLVFLAIVGSVSAIGDQLEERMTSVSEAFPD